MTTIDTAIAVATRGLTPERLRGLLERRGPTFIKIGQYLSLRPDILDEAYCNELLKLVDRVPAEPFRTVEKTIIADLGGTLSEHFSWIAKRPIAAASLSQVYPARTHDGAHVAVKVQRSGVAARVENDLRQLRRIVRALRTAGVLPDIIAGDVIAELRRWMSEELDLTQELANIARMFDLARDSDALIVPRPYPQLSGKRVVTMELLRGVPFSVILRAVRESNSETIARLRFDRRLLAERLIEAMLEQIFRFRMFQADSHPGNIIALPDNRIGFVDFGIVETLDPVLEAGLLRYLRAVYLNDVDEILRGLDEVLIPGDAADPTAFRQDFLEENRRMRRGRATGGGHDSPVGRYMMGVLRAARRNDMRLPTGILAIYRSLLTAETVAHQLATDVDLGSAGRDFFERLQRETLLRLPDLQVVQAEIVNTIEILRDAPKKLDRLVSDLASDRFRLRVEQFSSLADRRLRAAEVRLVVAALVFVGLAVLFAAAGGVSTAWLPFRPLLGGALFVNAVWMVVLWRKLP